MKQNPPSSVVHIRPKETAPRRFRVPAINSAGQVLDVDVTAESAEDANRQVAGSGFHVLEGTRERRRWAAKTGSALVRLASEACTPRSQAAFVLMLLALVALSACLGYLIAVNHVIPARQDMRSTSTTPPPVVVVNKPTASPSPSRPKAPKPPNYVKPPKVDYVLNVGSFSAELLSLQANSIFANAFNARIRLANRSGYEVEAVDLRLTNGAVGFMDGDKSFASIQRVDLKAYSTIDTELLLIDFPSTLAPNVRAEVTAVYGTRRYATLDELLKEGARPVNPLDVQKK